MKNNKDIPLSVQQKQLLSEKDFLYFCKYDYLNGVKLDNITSEFLRAAEKDRFLEPLLQSKNTAPQPNEQQKEETINYYSPHQLFIVSALSKNKVYEDRLWEPENIDFYKKQGIRSIMWGKNFGFTISYPKESNKKLELVSHSTIGDGEIIRARPKPKTDDPNHVYQDVCVDFHNFLRILHSCPQQDYPLDENTNRMRYFSKAPSLYFDFSLLRENSEDLLEKCNLDKDKLKRIALFIARIALDIDPLEHWYYYINLHPQTKKDLLKGKALLAQELYRIYDLVIEVIEIISNEKQPSMFEMLYGEQNIHPYLIPRIEYVQGTDVKSFWAAINKFKEWTKLENNKELVEESTIQRLTNLEKDLTTYEEKYGAKSFISNGIRDIEIEEKIKVENLDTLTKQYVNQILQQAQAQITNSGHHFLSFWDDELESMVKRKEMTLKEAKEKDYDLFIKREIFVAIEDRLRGLKRELWAIFDTVHKKIAQKAEEAWRIEHEFGNYFWFQHKDRINTFSREQQHKMYQKEYKKALEKAQYWTKKRDNFGKIQFEIELLYCSKCKQRPVQLHHEYSDKQTSTQYLCDKCFSEIKEQVLDMTAEDWKQVKEGEWQCDCYIEGTNRHPTLYKFAHRNTVSLWSKTNVPIKVELSYGRAILEAKCPNCGQVRKKEVDWGWIS